MEKMGLKRLLCPEREINKEFDPDAITYRIYEMNSVQAHLDIPHGMSARAWRRKQERDRKKGKNRI